MGLKIYSRRRVDGFGKFKVCCSKRRRSSLKVVVWDFYFVPFGCLYWVLY